MHGFGGQCTGTWTSEDVCWPRDFLRPRLKHARIAFFGYDADLSKFLPRSNDSDSVSEYASELLRHLKEWRAGEGAVSDERDTNDYHSNRFLHSATGLLYLLSTLLVPLWLKR